MKTFISKLFGVTHADIDPIEAALRAALMTFADR
jgi:hypothetical protein